MTAQITAPAIIINNNTLGIIPNSVKYTEGFGETDVRAESFGGGSIGNIYEDNIEQKFSNVMFEVAPTAPNINTLKAIKAAGDQNTVQVVASTVDGDLTRTVQEATITNNYEVQLGTGLNISIEMKGKAAI